MGALKHISLLLDATTLGDSCNIIELLVKHPYLLSDYGFLVPYLHPVDEISLDLLFLVQDFLFSCHIGGKVVDPFLRICAFKDFLQELLWCTGQGRGSIPADCIGIVEVRHIHICGEGEDLGLGKGCDKILENPDVGSNDSFRDRFIHHILQCGEDDVSILLQGSDGNSLHCGCENMYAVVGKLDEL